METLTMFDDYGNIIVHIESESLDQLFQTCYQGFMICYERGNGPTIYHEKGKEPPLDIDFIEIITSCKELNNYLTLGTRLPTKSLVKTAEKIIDIAENFSHVNVELLEPLPELNKIV